MTAQVAAEMRNYNLTILGISEKRWTGSGQQRIATGELLLYSGYEKDNAPHTQGVVLMLSKTAQTALTRWKAHGPRILKATFQTKKQKIYMDVIQCYAPTNDSNEDVKEEFYSILSTIFNCPRPNITIMMGDFNAKIGSNNRGYEEIKGQHGLREMNDNGERFTDLCALSNLVIEGSVFQHKRIYKATWVSPDLSTENQIDHVCICRKFRRSLPDVHVKRGADVAADHHLLIAKLKLKLKRNWTGDSCQRPQYDTTMLLKDTTKQQEFKIVLLNKCQVPEKVVEEETINEKWQAIKESFPSTCKEVLGQKKQHHKEWISAETLTKIKERKRKRQKSTTVVHEQEKPGPTKNILILAR